MIDIKDLRQNPDKFIDACKKKNIDENIINKLLDLDKKRREIITKTELLKNEQNKASKEIISLKDEEKKIALKNMKEVSNELKANEDALKKIDEDFLNQMLLLPNPPLLHVPVGKDDKENVEIRKWGTPRVFDFEPKDHVELGKTLDIIDIQRGVKISGSRFYFLKGDGALLQWALMQYTIEYLTRKGFTPLEVPLLVHYDAMMGTSYFPGGEEQAYHISKDKLFLVGTAEVALTSYHSNEILKEEELPKKYFGYSNCFRREAGTYGKDTHGLYRIHQFQKVEQVIICKNDPEVSQKMHEYILDNAEEVLKSLELPYRVVDVCTGDMGQGQVYKNDIETWMPSRKSYGETHSCSTFYDFQARRLKLRYKNKEGKNIYCHTLNNTCIASPRILIPIIEHYQTKDGNIEIPKVLQKYMGGKKIITKIS